MFNHGKLYHNLRNKIGQKPGFLNFSHLPHPEFNRYIAYCNCLVLQKSAEGKFLFLCRIKLI